MFRLSQTLLVLTVLLSMDPRLWARTPVDEDGPICPAGHLCNSAGEPIDEPQRAFVLFRNRASQPVPIVDAVTDQPHYFVRPGEIITADPEASGGQRLMEVYEGRAVERAGFIREQAFERVANSRVAGRVSVRAGSTALLFNQPGLTEAACQDASNRCVAQLSGSQQLQITGARLVRYMDNGREHTANFYEVSTAPSAGRRRVSGWINSSFVAVDGAPEPPRAPPGEPPCPPPGAPVPPETSGAISELSRATGRVSTESLNRIADGLAPQIGVCLLSDEQRANPNAVPQIVMPSRTNGGNQGPGTVYSTHLRPHWENRRLATPVNGPSGQPLTSTELESIDILARTLYGEIGESSCGGENPHYYTAVAAMTLNRIGEIQRDSRLRNPMALQIQRGETPTTTDLVLSPTQYSIWNPTKSEEIRRNPNGPRDQPRSRMVPNRGLRTVLCPPSNPTARGYRNNVPVPGETRSWREAVRAATAAILAGEHLQGRTNISVPYYTSRVAMGPGFEEVTGQRADGQPLNDPNCLRFWRERPEARTRQTNRTELASAVPPTPSARAPARTPQAR